MNDVTWTGTICLVDITDNTDLEQYLIENDIIKTFSQNGVSGVVVKVEIDEENQSFMPKKISLNIKRGKSQKISAEEPEFEPFCG